MRPRGFEPLTFGSVDRRSIQLSYGRKAANTRVFASPPPDLVGHITIKSAFSLVSSLWPRIGKPIDGDRVWTLFLPKDHYHLVQ